MLVLLIRDIPLALIRAAGYIAALVALFSAIVEIIFYGKSWTLKHSEHITLQVGVNY